MVIPKDILQTDFPVQFHQTCNNVLIDLLSPTRSGYRGEDPSYLANQEKNYHRGGPCNFHMVKF